MKRVPTAEVGDMNTVPFIKHAIRSKEAELEAGMPT